MDHVPPNQANKSAPLTQIAAEKLSTEWNNAKAGDNQAVAALQRTADYWQPFIQGNPEQVEPTLSKLKQINPEAESHLRKAIISHSAIEFK